MPIPPYKVNRRFLTVFIKQENSAIKSKCIAIFQLLIYLLLNKQI